MILFCLQSESGYAINGTKEANMLLYTTQTRNSTMTNDQMKANRFLRLYQARQKLQAITDHLSIGGQVLIATYTRATAYSAKHAAMFKATKSGLYVQRGKQWDCIDHCAIRFSKTV